jgi:hypothetical protein
LLTISSFEEDCRDGGGGGGAMGAATINILQQFCFVFNHCAAESIVASVAMPSSTNTTVFPSKLL